VPTASEILARLQGEPDRAVELAQVLLDHVLATPVRAFLEPARIVPAFVAGLRAGVDDAAAQRLGDVLRARQQRAVARPGPLADRLPPELRELLRRALRRPGVCGRELVRAAVDHAGMRALLRTILQTTLVDFAGKLGSIMPDTSWIPGAGIRSKLMGVAKGVASAVGAEVERQLEDRIRGFVDGALGRAIDLVVERGSDPRFAGDMAAWRSDAVLSVLSLPESVFLAERRKFDPHRIAADLVDAARALAGWERLPDEVAAALGPLVEELGERSVGDLLAGSGLVEAWREPLLGEMEHHLRRLFVADGFAAWFTRLVDGTGPEGQVPGDMSPGT
jgi:hypothetical protein